MTGLTDPLAFRTPFVSVLMPTYRQDFLIERSLASLLRQTLTDWELILVDDGSPDRTMKLVAPYLTDRRIRYYRFYRNIGLGAVLNRASRFAKGRYLAYLPSDDLYDPDHLSGLTAYLETHPEVFLAYAGVRSHRHWWGWRGLTLQGEADFELQGKQVIGQEREALAGRIPHGNALELTNNNIFALVQVMHRRDSIHETGWTERDDFVSDSLEPDFWRSLLDAGHRFASTGRVTCEWTDHPVQRNKIIAEAYDRPAPLDWPPSGRGLSAYRRYYGIRSGEALRWRPTLGPKVDEHTWYAGLTTDATAAEAVDPLRIHIVGELGFNPDRIIALEQAGHRLSATWADITETWDTASSLPVGKVEEVPWGPHWRARLAERPPDVIYALLNVHALPLVHSVLNANIGVPIVFHFKESPQRAMSFGLWQQLVELVSGVDGLILTSPENVTWYRAMFPNLVVDDRLLIMDGDLPLAYWMNDQFSSRISKQDGEPHIVCVGRPLSLRRLGLTAEAGVHVHCYGSNFHPPEVEQLAERTDRLHLHRTVEPADWVAELSRYDAAWVHDAASDNAGDIRKACWNDLNLPARLGTYAAAGLPWLVRATKPSVSAVGTLADRLGVGIPYDSIGELAAAVRRDDVLGEATLAMRTRRMDLSFDHHQPRLIEFLRKVARAGAGRGAPRE